MAKGGYRAGAGRKKGTKNKKPRKGSAASIETEQIKGLLSVGRKAKARFYQEYLIRVANTDGKQAPLSISEKKLMVNLGEELAAEIGEKAPGGVAEDLTPLELMLRGMRDPNEPKETRYRLAIAAAPFVHPRKGEGQGKKDEKNERAKAAGSGKFRASAPPMLKVVSK